MEVTRPRYEMVQGVAYLSVEIDGVRARIHWEQKLERFGFICLGDDFEEVVEPLLWPADPGNGRPDDEWLYGFTDDARVVALYERFMEDQDAGPVELGPVEMMGGEDDSSTQVSGL